MREYKGIEIGRVIFACLIPILHIDFPNNIVLEIVRQYIARLGVPFFFAISGMFLSKSIEKIGVKNALYKYLIRVGRVLLLWIVIYLPLLIYCADSYFVLIQQIIFKTPAFLWYLTSCFVAAIPFCLVSNRKALYVSAALLYFVGTLFGDNYKWLIGGMPIYEKIFLTTRNGIFFGLPLMCIGEISWKSERKSFVYILTSGVAFILEVIICSINTQNQSDRSMYFFLPIFIFYFIVLIREWNPMICVKYLGGISSAIYVMQYGIITIGTNIFIRLGLTHSFAMYLVYFAVIIFPITIYMLLRNKNIVKKIF